MEGLDTGITERMRFRPGVNYHVYPGGRQDPEIVALEQEMGADLFNERIGGIPLKACEPSVRRKLFA